MPPYNWRAFCLRIIGGFRRRYFYIALLAYQKSVNCKIQIHNIKIQMSNIVTLRCIARRMAGGSFHEHISHLQYIKHSNNTDIGEPAWYTRQEMVNYIETNGNTTVWCSG